MAYQPTAEQLAHGTLHTKTHNGYTLRVLANGNPNNSLTQIKVYGPDKRLIIHNPIEADYHARERWVNFASDVDMGTYG